MLNANFEKSFYNYTQYRTVRKDNIYRFYSNTMESIM